MSTQNQTKAHEEFNHAIKLREKYPLPFGAYKLREANRMFERFLGEVNILADCRRKKVPVRGVCTYGDHAMWLKGLPSKTIPYYLGYYLLPAINALDGDDVPIQEITRSLPFFSQEINSLLDRCDEAYNLIKRIGYEYELWDNYDSVLIPILDTSLWLVDIALDMVPPRKITYSNLTAVTV